MKYLLLILLLLPAAMAQNLSYEEHLALYPGRGEILKKDISITNYGKTDLTSEVMCVGNLCEFLNYPLGINIPANFTVNYPITVFTPWEPEVVQYDAELSFGGNVINIKAIILNGKTKAITNHLGSSLEIPNGDQPQQIRWAWVYLAMLIIGSAVLSLLIWMVTQSKWLSVILAFIIIVIAIVIIIMRSIYG